jgi:hypothetical protein
MTWQSPQSITQVRRILSSYERWIGKELLPGALKLPDVQLAETVYHAPRAILSHGTQADPVLNYGNEFTLKLWEFTWEELTATPSRLTAEPMERSERQRFLDQVTKNGYVADYRGIRISKSGKRFWIENAIVWNLVDEHGEKIGQAATFEKWTAVK